MLCLWFYFADRMKAFFLPEGETWNLELLLPQSETGYGRDLRFPVRSLNAVRHIAYPEAFRPAQGPESHEYPLDAGAKHNLSDGRYAIAIVARSLQKDATRFSKYRLPPGQTVEIGRADSGAIVMEDGLVSLRHALLYQDGDRAAVLRDSSSNGTYINGKKLLGGEARLAFGDTVQIPGGLTLVWLGETLAVNSPQGLRVPGLAAWEGEASPPSAPSSPEAAIYPFFRAPRLLHQADTAPVEIEAPPPKEAEVQRPWFLTIGPALTMLLPMGASVLVYSLAGGSAATRALSLAAIGASSALGLLWGGLSLRHQRKTERAGEQKRQALYRQYIGEQSDLLQGRADAAKARLLAQHPSPVEIYEIATKRNQRLWERMPAHDDFLCIRLGRGDLPLPMPIVIPRDGLSMIDDPLRDLPAGIKARFETLEDMPVTLSLRTHRVVGIAGHAYAHAMLQSIAAQIAALHSYHDVRLVILHGEGRRSQWSWARWLPHCFATEARGLRLVASRPGDIGEALSFVEEVLTTRMEISAGKGGEAVLPHFVICCTEPSLLEGQPILRQLLSGAPGVSLIMLAESYGRLPKECSVALDLAGDACALYEMAGSVRPFSGEILDGKLLDGFARALAPVRAHEPASASGIPALVTFLDLCGVRRVEELDVWRYWNENHAYEGLRAAIGLAEGSRPFVLDISEKQHGPHGLVAGTTGSGKSVALQTYILSLALSYAPSEVQFVLIDYKGGGMAAAFLGLPHLAGVITNLDGRLINRALRAIEAEALRRQALLAEAGVEHIDAYMRLRGAGIGETPLAHLVIIADEFAELKADQPEFMAQLISIARVGRSLGIHLILATQKPSNSVSDEIWSNSRFKLCLRVQDRADSNGMLKRPEAAYLRGMGRCYVQIGNDELFMQVQTSWAGAAYQPDLPREEELAVMLDEIGRKTPMPRAKTAHGGGPGQTQLTAVLALLKETATRHGVPPAQPLWKDVLPPVLLAGEIDAFARHAFSGGAWHSPQGGPLCPVVGMGDDLTRQAQYPLAMDFAEHGNLLVVGLGGTGKTTFAQTLAVSLAAQYTPAQAQLYVYSLSTRTLGSLAHLPHVGEVLFEEEQHEQRRLLTLIERECAERSARFAEASTDSFAEYNRHCQRSGREAPPAWVILIDRMEQIRLALEEPDLQRLYTLLRESPSRGIYFVVTALSKGEAPARLHSHFTGIALQLASRSDYRDVLGCPVGPEDTAILATPGRGLVRAEGAHEFQTALHGSPGDAERAEYIRALGQQMRDAWTGTLPKGIARIPREPTWEAFAQNSRVAAALADPLTLPLAYGVAEGEPVCLSLPRDFTWLVYGPARSGKSTVLRNVLRAFSAKNAQLCVISPENRLTLAARQMQAAVFAPGEARLQAYLESVSAEMGRRALLRKQALAQGEDALLLCLRGFTPVVICIDELELLLQSSREDILSFLTTTARSAAQFGIYLFAALSQENAPRAAGNALAGTLVSAHRAILLGGRLDVYDPWNLRIPYAQKAAMLPPGHGLLYAQGEAADIILPQ